LAVTSTVSTFQHRFQNIAFPSPSKFKEFAAMLARLVPAHPLRLAGLATESGA
jgi:hypothetical protein